LAVFHLFAKLFTSAVILVALFDAWRFVRRKRLADQGSWEAAVWTICGLAGRLGYVAIWGR